LIDNVTTSKAAEITNFFLKQKWEATFLKHGWFTNKYDHWYGHKTADNKFNPNSHCAHINRNGSNLVIGTSLEYGDYSVDQLKPWCLVG